jgi:uncharacterized protein (TIGR02246 family)
MSRSPHSSVAAWFLVSLALLPLGATAGEAAKAGVDEAAIRALVAEQAEAWNRGDAAAWSKDFVSEADFVNIFGMVLNGREEIEKRHADIFATIFKGSRTQVTVRRFVLVGKDKDVAVVDTDHVVTGYGKLPPTVHPTGEPAALRTHMKYVMKKVDGRWWIIAGQNTDVKPPPGAGAKASKARG